MPIIYFPILRTCSQPRFALGTSLTKQQPSRHRGSSCNPDVICPLDAFEMWLIEHFLLIRKSGRRPLLRTSRNTIAALGVFNGEARDVISWLHPVSLEIQTWEYGLDAIELPVSTTESIMRAWLQTNEENIHQYGLVSI